MGVIAHKRPPPPLPTLETVSIRHLRQKKYEIKPNIIIKDRQGNIVFRFRRVRIKEVKKNLDEAIRRIMESAISRNH